MSGNFTLNSGKIVLADGLTPDDVVLNVTASGNAISTSGGLNNESVIHGIPPTPNSGIAFAPGQIDGKLIAGGQTVHLVSGANANEITTNIWLPSPRLGYCSEVGCWGWSGSRVSGLPQSPEPPALIIQITVRGLVPVLGSSDHLV
jgi:hypothetical protein